MSIDQEIFRAYNISQIDLDQKEIEDILINLNHNMRTYTLVYQVIQSNRHASIVLHEANKIGMYIPPVKRYMLNAYEFFIHNIAYYESTFDRGDKAYPTQEEIFLSPDPYSLLSMYRDDQILQPGYQFTRNYNDRQEMILKFITDNYQTIGKFELPSNLRPNYVRDAKLVFYSSPTEKYSYSMNELFRCLDYQQRVMWKANKQPFHQLSVLYLRQQLLEKLSKWKDYCGLPNDEQYRLFLQLIQGLDKILVKHNLQSIDHYICSPQLPDIQIE